MKKQYMKPSVKAIKIESTNIICGSGKERQSLRMGNATEDDDTPESISGWDRTGIFGE